LETLFIGGLHQQRPMESILQTFSIATILQFLYFQLKNSPTNIAPQINPFLTKLLSYAHKACFKLQLFEVQMVILLALELDELESHCIVEQLICLQRHQHQNLQVIFDFVLTQYHQSPSPQKVAGILCKHFPQAKAHLSQIHF